MAGVTRFSTTAVRKDENPRIKCILLSSKNPDFERLIFEPEDAEGLTLLAVFQGVLK